MNELTLNNTLSMTSREIAELTGKRHADVLCDIDRLLESLSPELKCGFKLSTYISGDPPREYRQFILDQFSYDLILELYKGVMILSMTLVMK